MKQQEQLDWMDIADTRIGKFLENVSNWNNHRPLLLLALDLTEGDVIEYGSGDGSTPYLKKYCDFSKRKFVSYDSNKEWAKKTGAKYVQDWDKLSLKDCGLCFIDLAPGEYRHIMIDRMKDKADIICVHDSEIGGSGNYMLDKVFPLFEYQLHYNRHGGGAGASLISNKIDVSAFKGLTLGTFKFDE